MTNLNYYFTSCVLLLLLTCWQTSTGLPLASVDTGKCAQSSLLFKSLLLNITELLNSDLLCYGITSDKVVLNTKAETLQACVPTISQHPSCMIQRNSSFSESECFRNIMKDLDYYETAIKSYLQYPLRSHQEEALLNPILGIIKSLKDCCPVPGGQSDSSEDDSPQVWGNNTFDNRQKMCNMMRGFRVRAITINRAMGYISAGDHRK